MLKIAISGTGFIEWGGGIDFLRGVIATLIHFPENEYYLFLPAYSLDKYPKFLRKNFKSLLKIYENVVAPEKNEYLYNFFKVFEPKLKIIFYKGSIQKAIEKINPNVIIPTWDMLYNKCNIPQVAYLYDCQHRYYPENFDEHTIKSRDKYFKRVVDNYEAVIVASQTAKNDLIKFYNANPDKIFDITCLPIFNPSYFEDLSFDVKEKYGINNRYFIICSQFWMHKSHITAIEALSKLKDKNINLVCTGKMEDYRNPLYMDELKQKIEQLGVSDRVKLLGYIDKREQIELIKNSVALIQPTLYEGGAGAGGVAEAISLGQRVILSDIPINAELNSFEDLIYFKTADSMDLSVKMGKLLNEEPPIKTKEKLIRQSNECVKRRVRELYKAIDFVINKGETKNAGKI